MPGFGVAGEVLQYAGDPCLAEGLPSGVDLHRCFSSWSAGGSASPVTPPSAVGWPPTSAGAGRWVTASAAARIAGSRNSGGSVFVHRRLEGMCSTGTSKGLVQLLVVDELLIWPISTFTSRL